MGKYFFEAFFKEYFSKFYAFATRFVEDHYACEDIVQETFIAVWEEQDNSYASLLMFQAYIYRTIRNKILNYLKHVRIRERYSRDYLKEVESEKYMLHSVLEEETYFVLHAAIRRLSPQCQRVIRLHLEGLSNKEIAAEMQISVVTVKSHKMFAYRELRDMLKDVTSLVLFIVQDFTTMPSSAPLPN